jgi:glycosyltransferase involved in cell wall biosynthesis
MTAVSDVELPAEFWRDPARHNGALRRLVFVGSLEQLYKAPDVLLDAMALCLRESPSFLLTIVGEGRHLPELEQRARTLGIADRVRFAGKLGASAVREELDRSSLFVLPSRTEGLPRAMLEAMARGLPAIGSAVGGIPELLAAEDLVPAGDAPALARRILEVTRDPRRMDAMSERNRRKALEYREENLRPRRVAFYRHVAEATRQWLGRAARWEVAGDACTPCREDV